MAALEQLLVRFSRLVVEQCWIKEIDINPLLASPERLLALDARIVAHGPEVREDAQPRLAIRPYPTQYVQPWVMQDGAEVLIRPIRPEDEPLMVKFHAMLSDRSVYSRFFHGQPQFAPIESTPLQYAVNTSTPVVEVAPSLYYAVENGIWFVATSPTGPWAVATSVPIVIYSIPPSCPIYYVTYVRVYRSTPTVVYCDYTPGYYGTVVSSDGVVVFGTGWHYPPYIGKVWIGYSWTYGFGAAFTWSLGGGWSFDLGVGYGYPIFGPWYGPLRWGWRTWWRRHYPWARHDWWRRRYPWIRRGWDGFGRVNVYERLGRARARIRPTVRARPGIIRIPRSQPLPGGNRPRTGQPGTGRPRARPDNLFATKDGRVYRYLPGSGWQQHDNRT